MKSFNPCSIGFSFRSGEWNNQGATHSGVSILVLLDFPFGDVKEESVTFMFVLFQSLFYWIFLSERNAAYDVARSLGSFNPCSIGFSFRSGSALPHRPWEVRVSILVLLDFPFGAKRVYDSGQNGCSFNPCSIGFSFRSRAMGYGAFGWVGFQSLLYWNFLLEMMWW